MAVLIALALACTLQEDVGPLLEPIRKKHDLPGLAALAIRGGKTVGAGAVGVRRRGAEEKIRIADRFHLGSCTKSMTATLVARLVEREKLSWSMTVGEVFDDVEMDPAWKGVTLELLLKNHGGAPGTFEPELFGKLRLHEGAPVEQRRTLAEGVLGRPPEAPPGTKYIYSNAGFCIAGAMAETVTGTSWEALMRRELFEPLGMKSAGFGPPGTKDKLDEPVGHRADGSPVGVGPWADNPPSLGPAGRVHASLGDWAKYVALHLRGDASYLKPGTLARLHRPAETKETQYAMGWIVTDRPWGGGTVLAHSGSNTLWYCVVWMAPKKDFAVLVAANQGGRKGALGCDDAASALIRRFPGR